MLRQGQNLIGAFSLTFIKERLRLQFRGAVRAAGGFDGNDAYTMRAFLGGGVCRGGSLLHVVSCSHNEEDDEGNDQEVHYGLKEQSPHDCGTANRNGQFAEVDSAHEQTDQRHEDVIDEGGYDLAECTAYDDTNGHVEYISAHDKFFEFFEHVEISLIRVAVILW